jgi:hypothetical protein
MERREQPPRSKTKTRHENKSKGEGEVKPLSKTQI